MKKNIAFFFLFLSFFGFSQNDTLFYTGFDSLIVDVNEKLDPVASNKLDVHTWMRASISSSLSSKILSEADNEEWYDSDLWEKWHKMSYTELLGTTTLDDTVLYNVYQKNVGYRSFSWFQVPGQAQNLMLSEPIFLGDSASVLKWKSMPIQGPRFQDGYKVYVSEGGGHTIETFPVFDLEPNFVMKQLDVSTSSPDSAITSLKMLLDDFDLIPEDGTDHINYRLPDTFGGIVDSTRQIPFMQEFELDLSEYSGFIQIAFYHDSYDNNGIMLDDILVTGTGSVGMHEKNKLGFNLYPNPAINSIYLKMEDGSTINDVSIFTLKGQLVSKVTYKSFQIIDVSTLKPGSYLIKVTTESGYYSTRFSKIK